MSMTGLCCVPPDPRSTPQHRALWSFVVAACFVTPLVLGDILGAPTPIPRDVFAGCPCKRLHSGGFKLSGALYRLYANILRELVTKWCVENRKVPDTQFGFYPDRSTIQPMFILRHLVHAAKQMKPKGFSHLHTAFIDFKQAYDTIDRPHLWDHLNYIRMPTHLVNVIKQMYDGDEYVLIDGACQNYQYR